MGDLNKADDEEIVPWVKDKIEMDNCLNEISEFNEEIH